MHLIQRASLRSPRQRPSLTRTIGSLCLVIGLSLLASQIIRLGGTHSAKATEQEAIADDKVFEITVDTKLDPTRDYPPLLIRTSGITLDGAGTTLVGPGTGDPKTHKGVAITVRGAEGVTIKNVKAKGWESGLHLRECREVTVEACDFSNNFHDPKFGWGENGRRGGIILESSHRCVLKKNVAKHVWDACVLVDSNENRILNNDFSHTSNTCLKLWNASRNVVENNNLSYGIRIDPGEVHARDSTSVLLESGSNDNRLTKNDCSHGGDGIFVRVLNGWVSTGNVFEENDCSYANNNCVEAWSPRNMYIRNKANHGSYGFWLGASDQTVLIDNEASFNGLATGNHNSPHLPERGHAGIVFMFGPSSHTIVRGNRCEGNNGAGIAVIGDQESRGKKFKAYHWIIENNRLEKNRWGIFAQHADWIDLAANLMVDNSVAGFFDAGNVSHVTVHQSERSITRPPIAKLIAVSAAKVGERVKFDASESHDPARETLTYRWDLGDGTFATSNRVEHQFAKPGFYRVGLTVNNGLLSDLAWRDFYVTEDLPETATENNAAQWSWEDDRSRVEFDNDMKTRIAGETSLQALVSPYSGGRVNLVFPRKRDLDWKTSGKSHVVLWVKSVNENLPAWQGENPIVALRGDNGKTLTLTPTGDFLSNPPYTEAREGWIYFEIPLAGNDRWKLVGTPVDVIRQISIGFDSWGAPPLKIWIDGLALRSGNLE